MLHFLSSELCRISLYDKICNYLNLAPKLVTTTCSNITKSVVDGFKTQLEVRPELDIYLDWI